MTLFDIFILVVFIGAILYGLKKGIITQLGALGGIIVGVVLCRLLGSAVTKALSPADSSAEELYVYGIFINIILFIAGYLGTRILARLLRTVTSTLSLSLFDRILGVVFSVFEWMLFLSFFLNIWQAFSPDVNIIDYSKMGNRKPARALVDLAPAVLGAETSEAIFGTVEKVGQIKRITDQFKSDEK